MFPGESEPNNSLPTRQAGLRSPAPDLDKRVHAYRRDLADIRLAGRVSAPHYSSAVQYRGLAARTPVRAEPRQQASLTTELLLGEPFAVLELAGEWAWGWCGRDGYVGYVPSSHIGVRGPQATHRVSVGSALIFSEASIKAPVKLSAPFNAQLCLEGMENSGDFHAVDGGGYVHRRHVEPLESNNSSHIELARLFLGVPYMWGGRTTEGVDCSGLVQAALFGAGIDCPRDSDQQMQAIGSAVEGAQSAGDVVFFPGHVGILVDQATLLHANAFWMRTVMEPLADVVARFGPDVQRPVLAIRRP